MPNTANYSLPYPQSSDTPDVPRDMLALANAVDSTFNTRGTWSTYTATWTNVTTGNGTSAASYTRIGKTIHMRAQFTLGSTSAVTNYVAVSLPVTAANNSYIGNVYYFDTSATATTIGYVDPSSSTTGVVVGVVKADQTYAYGGGMSATVPFTWATGDIILVTLTYQAAS